MLLGLEKCFTDPLRDFIKLKSFYKSWGVASLGDLVMMRRQMINFKALCEKG